MSGVGYRNDNEIVHRGLICIPCDIFGRDDGYFDRQKNVLFSIMDLLSHIVIADFGKFTSSALRQLSRDMLHVRTMSSTSIPPESSSCP
jgi:hypothetical protein